MKLPHAPKTEYHLVEDMLFKSHYAHALLLSHTIGVFELLNKSPLSLNELCDKSQLKTRPMQAIVSLCQEMNFIQYTQDKKYCLTDLSKEYLIASSPFYLGKTLDYSIENNHLYSFESFRDSVLKDSTPVFNREGLFKSNENDIEKAQLFTDTMHEKSLAIAMVWINFIDLSGHSIFLDIGGGSGIHSISIASKYKNITAIVYEQPTVSSITKQYIANYNMQDKIKVCIGDMFSYNNKFPNADCHFYSDIFHDFTPEKITILATKSYNSLSKGGRIILLEKLFNDEKSGPSTTVTYNSLMLTCTEGQQYSQKELRAILSDVGFESIDIISTNFGGWSIITALKT